MHPFHSTSSHLDFDALQAMNIPDSRDVYVTGRGFQAEIVQMFASNLEFASRAVFRTPTPDSVQARKRGPRNGTVGFDSFDPQQQGGFWSPPGAGPRIRAHDFCDLHFRSCPGLGQVLRCLCSCAGVGFLIGGCCFQGTNFCNEISRSAD